MNDLTVSISEMNIFQLHIRSGTMFWLCRLWQFLHIKKRLDTGLYLCNNSSTFQKSKKVCKEPTIAIESKMHKMSSDRLTAPPEKSAMPTGRTKAIEDGKTA